MNMPALNKPEMAKQTIIRAFNDLIAMSGLGLQDSKCTSVGKWLEFKVVLHGGYSFLMYFGATRKVLSHCRRMCRTGRRYVQGVAYNMKQGFDELKRKIVERIISVRQAFSCGNRAVVSQPDNDDFGFSRHDMDVITPPARPMFRSSMTRWKYA